MKIAAPSAAAKAMVWEGTTTAIKAVEADEGSMVSTVYYNASGVREGSLQHGLNIIKTQYSNGKTTVRKVMVK